MKENIADIKRQLRNYGRVTGHRKIIEGRTKYITILYIPAFNKPLLYVTGGSWKGSWTYLRLLVIKNLKNNIEFIEEERGRKHR